MQLASITTLSHYVQIQTLIEIFFVWACAGAGASVLYFYIHCLFVTACLITSNFCSKLYFCRSHMVKSGLEWISSPFPLVSFPKFNGHTSTTPRNFSTRGCFYQKALGWEITNHMHRNLPWSIKLIPKCLHYHTTISSRPATPRCATYWLPSLLTAAAPGCCSPRILLTLPSSFITTTHYCKKILFVYTNLERMRNSLALYWTPWGEGKKLEQKL